MRQTLLRALVCLAITTTDVQGGHRIETAQGRLELRNALPTEFPNVVGRNWFQAPRRVVETQGALYWVAFLFDHGDTLRWPSGQTIGIVLADSTVIEDSLLMVSQPKESLTMRPTMIAGGAVIQSSDLWRKPCPWKGTCTILMAGFPRRRLPENFNVSDVADVRIGTRRVSSLRRAAAEWR